MVDHFEFDRFEIFQGISQLKSHILLYGDGLAIWHGLPDIRHILKLFMVVGQPFK